MKLDAKCGSGILGERIFSMVVSGSPKRWDRWHSPSPNWQEKYHLYTTYIYCLLGGYMLPTTFYGNQKQPLIFWPTLVGLGYDVCVYIYIYICMLYHIFRIYTRCAPTRYKWSDMGPL